MKDFAKRLGITKQGSFEDGRYIIELGSSDEYSKVYTLLDNSSLVDIDQELTVMTADKSELTYKGDDFDVVLSADLNDNVYKVIITEVN